MANESAIFQKTACKVAIEFGFSKTAIFHCYENGMRAGDLISELLDLESNNSNFRFQNEISFKISKDEAKEEPMVVRNYSELCTKINELDLMAHSDIHTLRKQTIDIWAKYQCHTCGVNKSNRLAIPCTHLVTCENCISDKCIVCKEKVTDWIKIFI